MDEDRSSKFVRLLVRHEPDLVRHALPYVGGCLDDARDAVQDAAVALWKRIGDYDADQPFLPWARAFVRNAALALARKRRRYTFLSDELLELMMTEPDDPDDTDVRRRSALALCLQRLTAEDRELVELRYRDPHRTIQQVAAEAGRSPNILYKALARARRLLLNCVKRRTDAE